MRDLLVRDKARKMTFVTDTPGKEAREALLDYRRLDEREGTSLVSVLLHTGRTHQIRVQFASRGLPLVGERKYALQDDPCALALFSHALCFRHPVTGEGLSFTGKPGVDWPWSIYKETVNKL